MNMSWRKSQNSRHEEPAGEASADLFAQIEETVGDAADGVGGAVDAAGDGVSGVGDVAGGVSGDVADDVTGNGAGNGESAKAADESQQSQQSPKHHKKSNALLNILIAISAIAMIGALGLIAYPTFSDWWNRMHQSYAVASYVEHAEDMSAAERKAMLDAAHAYNERLATNSDRWHMTDEQKREYNETLDVTGTGIMGYVTIPRIKVKLPVYHGTSDGVLQIAAGHLAGTSLPVGGATTHAVVSGHTGLPSARLLTGLDELKKGDTFAFHVLDQTYATLITCTPYGINSHRLLVRGHRIPNPKVPDKTQYDEPGEMTAVAAAAIGLIVFVAGCAFVGLAQLWRRSWIVRHGLCAGAGARHSSGVRG